MELAYPAEQMVDCSSDSFADSAAEPRAILYPPTQIHPPYPLFTRQGNDGFQNRSLASQTPHTYHDNFHSPSPFPTQPTHIHQPQPSRESPQSWPSYDQPVPQPFVHSGYPLAFPSYPCPSPFPPIRRSPPPAHHQSFQYKGVPQNHVPSSSNAHRLTLAGSLDPTTGIFYRTPEHPRLRTAQACEKCRTRKAKCSGEHPSCKRCITRGLVCEYAKEGRVRGPNKPKPKATAGDASGAAPNSSNSTSGRTGSRGRTSSTNSSGSSEHSQANLSLVVKSALMSRDADSRDTRTLIGHRRNSLSLGESRSSRPRPPDLHLETTSHLYRLSNGEGPRTSPTESLFLPFHQQQHRDPPFMNEDDGLQVRMTPQPNPFLRQRMSQQQQQQQMQLQRNIMAMQVQAQARAHHAQSQTQSVASASPTMGRGRRSLPHSMSLSHDLAVHAVSAHPQILPGDEEFIYPSTPYSQPHPYNHHSDADGGVSSSLSRL